jgi:hypothetical protein
MTSYRVCFFNEIPRNDRLFKCCQRSIVIRSARTSERAIEAAKKRFARLEHIPNWQIHAGSIEIEPIEPDQPPKSPTDMSAGKPRYEKNIRHRARPKPADVAARRDG